MSKDIFSLMKGHAKITKPVHGPKQATTVVGLRVGLGVDSTKPGWKIEGSHLIKRVPIVIRSDDSPEKTVRKIAAFDLDGTLIKTRSGLSFARSPHDWQWFNGSVSSELAKLHRENYLLVIFTNQGGVVAEEKQKKPSKSYTNFIQRVEAVMESLKKEIEGIKKVNGEGTKRDIEKSKSDCDIEKLEKGTKCEDEKNDINDNQPHNIDIYVYASPKRPASSKTASPQFKHDDMRKPGIGMWQELIRSLEETGFSVDIEKSFFVGDAAGRANDFLDSDRKFAEAIGITFKEPEEIFTE